jgi:hypothetical protein
VTQSGQRFDGDGEKMEKMEKTKKRGRNHFAMEGIKVKGIH